MAHQLNSVHALAHATRRSPPPCTTHILAAAWPASGLPLDLAALLGSRSVLHIQLEAAPRKYGPALHMARGQEGEKGQIMGQAGKQGGGS